MDGQTNLCKLTKIAFSCEFLNYEFLKLFLD